MPTGRFRLEPLLKIRRLEEDRAKRVVADRLREISKAGGQIAGLAGQMAEAGATMRSLVLAGRIVPQEASRQRGYMGSLAMRQLEMNGRMAALQAHLARERAALAEATQRRKMLEKLKERQQQRQARQAAIAEQRDSDELGAVRFAHGLSEDAMALETATEGREDTQ